MFSASKVGGKDDELVLASGGDSVSASGRAGVCAMSVVTWGVYASWTLRQL